MDLKFVPDVSLEVGRTYAPPAWRNQHLPGIYVPGVLLIILFVFIASGRLTTIPREDAEFGGTHPASMPWCLLCGDVLPRGNRFPRRSARETDWCGDAFLQGLLLQRTRT